MAELESTTQVDTPYESPAPPNGELGKHVRKGRVRPRNSTNGYVERRGARLLRQYGGRAKRQGLAEARLLEASRTRLIARRFKKNRVATISLFLLVAMYVLLVFGTEFVAPYGPNHRFVNATYETPQRVHLFDAKGGLHMPFVYSQESKLNILTFRYSTVTDTSERHAIEFFVKTAPYKLAGVIPMDRRLFGGADDHPVFLFGTNGLGQDMFSRIVYGSRVSLMVGLTGVALSFVIGVLLGGMSGYFGGIVDLIIQRLIEFIISIPLIPLWMGLSAAIPRSWSGIQRYFAITLILSLVGWTGLARVVRGKVISLRDEDYVTAARLSSARNFTIIRKHLLPGVTSYLIVYITIAIPYMILAETTLSFLGLGILPPDVSWGSLLEEAQQITVVADYPWLLMPAAFLVMAVLLFNFIGDGLRDATDPYST